ncbi:hypothetical protein Pst134EB_010874 [Puccinia striiformis f. sp. tritici]|nr:hypothetical protein Pst134EB_010874 [Puccinia striiformis f. sp. tritici]
MSGQSNFLDRACEIVRQAIDEDIKQNWEESLKLYKNALDYFHMAYKYEKNPKLKDLIRSKMEEYLERAEKLKTHVSTPDDKRGRQAVGANGKSANGEGGSGANADGDDADTKKLRGALSSAILAETPNVSWDDVAGLEGAKESLKEAVILPIKFPHLFTVSSSDLVSKWMGESERLVKQLFTMARENKPAIIFIDEVDSLCGTRGEGESEAARRIKTEFLVQMNGVGNDAEGVLVLGATNIPWQLDIAIQRRFEKRIFIPLPDPEARKRIFELNVGTTPCTLTQQDYRELASQSQGYSGSDIAVVVRDALMQPVRKVLSATHFRPVMVPTVEDPTISVKKLTPCSPGDPLAIEKSWNEVEATELLEPSLTLPDFLRALRNTSPTVREEDIKRHLEFTNESGADGA